MGECVRLARASSGDHQQRPGDIRASADHAMLDGAALRFIQAGEIGRAGHAPFR
jgi:hypothetical protein